jgi:hypothetical protein
MASPFLSPHRLTKVYLGSMSRDEHSCTHWLRPHNSPVPLALGLKYEGAISPCLSLSYMCSRGTFSHALASRGSGDGPKAHDSKKPGIFLFSLVFMSSQSCNKISSKYRKKEPKNTLTLSSQSYSICTHVVAMNSPKQNPLKRRPRLHPLLYI